MAILVPHCNTFRQTGRQTDRQTDRQYTYARTYIHTTNQTYKQTIHTIPYRTVPYCTVHTIPCRTIPYIYIAYTYIPSAIIYTHIIIYNYIYICIYICIYFIYIYTHIRRSPKMGVPPNPWWLGLGSSIGNLCTRWSGPWRLAELTGHVSQQSLRPGGDTDTKLPRGWWF